nr:DJ-1/PfpI family protein [Methanosarcina horonobensis]
MAFKDVNPADYDILVISGGKGPEKMRLDKDALEISRHFFSKKINPLPQSATVRRFLFRQA